MTFVADIGYATIGMGALLCLSVTGMWLRGDFRRPRVD